jgi:tetratricopeptide (TPR) repeat protein
MVWPSLRAQDSEQTATDEIQSAIKSGRIDQAVDQAREAVGRYPKSSEIYQLLGVALFKKGLNADAQTAFRRAIELDPSVPQNYYDLALVNLSEKLYTRAAARLETYLRLEPENANAHVLLGHAYHNLNETTPAIEQFKKALTLNPQLPLAHFHLGFAYQSQGNLKGALEEFRKEIELNPAFVESYWHAGDIELEQGELAAAEELFQKGLRLKPAAFEGHYGLGRVLLAQKQFSTAQPELERAIELEPTNVEAHYALARAYQQMGNSASAEAQFAICARLNAERQRTASGIAGKQP